MSEIPATNVLKHHKKLLEISANVIQRRMAHLISQALYVFLSYVSLGRIWFFYTPDISSYEKD